MSGARVDSYRADALVLHTTHVLGTFATRIAIRASVPVTHLRIRSHSHKILSAISTTQSVAVKYNMAELEGNRDFMDRYSRQIGAYGVETMAKVSIGSLDRAPD